MYCILNIHKTKKNVSLCFNILPEYIFTLLVTLIQIHKSIQFQLCFPMSEQYFFSLLIDLLFVKIPYRAV